MEPRLILDHETPLLPPLSDPKQFESVFLRSYLEGQPKIMRHHGDSLLRTVTFEILSELMGNENDSDVMKMMPWAVSNVFYEQIFLHYDFQQLRPGLPLAESKGLTEKRGDVLEAYMAGIAMDISRGGGEGYQEIRDWLYNIMRLRLNKVAGGSQADISTRHPESPLLELRRSVFDSMKQVVKQVQWKTATRTSAQLDFWSRVRTYLNSLCTKVLPSQEAQVLLLHYYRVYTNFHFLTVSRT